MERSHIESNVRNPARHSSPLLAKLKACRSLVDLKNLHAVAITTGHISSIYVANTLIRTYGRFRSLREAQGIFEDMPYHSVVSWNVFIQTYVENGEEQKALELFSCMHLEGLVPDACTFVAAARACTGIASAEEARKQDHHVDLFLGRAMAVHSQVLRWHMESNIFVATSLIDMYGKLSRLLEAERVFDAMPSHDVACWNTLMMGYAENAKGYQTLILLSKMKAEGCVPDKITYLAALKALRASAKAKNASSLEMVEAIHYHCAAGCYNLDLQMDSTLISVYAECGFFSLSQRVFGMISHPDVVAWTALVLGYADNGKGTLALEGFARLQYEGCCPNARTFAAAAKACTTMAESSTADEVGQKAMALHSEAVAFGCDSDTYFSTSLINLYARCGQVSRASRVFRGLRHPDVVAWTSLLMGYVENGEVQEEALRLFACMLFHGHRPDAQALVAAVKACTESLVSEESQLISLQKCMALHRLAASVGFETQVYVRSALVGLYTKLGSLVEAQWVFVAGPDDDVVLWNAMIFGYVENGEARAALDCLSEMRAKHLVPDATTFTGALKSCTMLSALDAGREIHAEARKLGLEADQSLAHCLIDFYGKCGSMADARKIFDSLPTKNTLSWTSLMAGYSRQGDMSQVFELLDCMPEEDIDGVTLLCVLTACSHSGLVDEGKIYFEAMSSKYGIDPGIEHYRCMIDLLGRANDLAGVLELVRSMPFRWDAVTWTTVLASCVKWGNVVLGRLAFEFLLSLDEDGPARCLMASIYRSKGMWEEGARLFNCTNSAQLTELNKCIKTWK